MTVKWQVWLVSIHCIVLHLAVLSRSLPLSIYIHTMCAVHILWCFILFGHFSYIAVCMSVCLMDIVHSFHSLFVALSLCISRELNWTCVCVCVCVFHSFDLTHWLEISLTSRIRDLCADLWRTDVRANRWAHGWKIPSRCTSPVGLVSIDGIKRKWSYFFWVPQVGLLTIA